MLPETKSIMEDKAELLIELSKLMGWEYEISATQANFKGYRKWRKEYNSDLESVLFSTGKINEFDKQSFIDWFDKLPSQARYRVKNRIFYSRTKDTDTLKYAQLKPWVEEWENYKESKQEEKRVLEEKIRQGQATEEDKLNLQKIAKEAKINVGATNFKELYDEGCLGRVDKLKLEALEKSNKKKQDKMEENADLCYVALRLYIESEVTKYIADSIIDKVSKDVLPSDAFDSDKRVNRLENKKESREADKLSSRRKK